MRKLLLIAILASPCLANGPKYVGSGTDVQVYQEFGNVYNDIRALPSAAKVLQTASGTSTSATSTTSTSYADTALSVTITPTSASSKIVIWVKTYAFINVNGAGIIYGISRAGTDLVAAGIAQTTMALAGRAPVPVSFVYQDSPATTSPTVYMLRVKSNFAGNDVRDNIDTLLTSMYIEEVQ